MFASTSLRMHFGRGFLGFLALSLALFFADLVWPVILLMPLALWAFRGCPVCWATGLIEMLAMRAFKSTDVPRV
jgi:hypothetical protein